MIYYNRFGKILFINIVFVSVSEKVLNRCEEKNLVLNWEKCHFMETNDIQQPHIVSSTRIEVDESKIELIANLPTPKSIKDVRSFLGHASFYKRLSKILV